MICLFFFTSSSKFCSWRFLLFSTSDVFTSFSHRRLLVWVYHEWCVDLYAASPYNPLILSNFSSQNTAFWKLYVVFEAYWWEHRHIVSFLIPRFRATMTPNKCLQNYVQLAREGRNQITMSSLERARVYSFYFLLCLFRTCDFIGLLCHIIMKRDLLCRKM